SGVVYHELIEETRTRLAERRKTTATDRVLRWVFFNIFTNPTRLKLAMLPARLMQRVGLWGAVKRLGGMLPKEFEKMQQMLPEQGPVWEKALEPFYPARAPDGKKRGTAALLQGCVGSVLFQHVNRQTIDLLTYAGCDVIVPRAQRCCGAIHHHSGGEHEAQ